MAIETLIWLLPVPPLLAFFAIVLFTNKDKKLSHSVAIGAALLTWLGSMVVFGQAIAKEHFGEHPFASSINWLPTADSFLKVGVLIDPLSAIVLFFVACTVLMIFIYSVGYHNFGQPVGDHDQAGLPPHGATIPHGDHSHTVLSIEPMYSRFFAFISLFAFGMFTLVISDNLLTMFVGWEIMGLCSYLLIGFWFGKPSARAAAVKAFMTTRVGDVFMLLGIAWLYSYTGTLSFREIFQPELLHTMGNAMAFPELAMQIPALYPIISSFSVAGAIGLLLFIGTVGKSAQWPLHVWLPDAMEGPTPVSAMIHAATMVSAGIYAVLRIFPIIEADVTGTLMPIIALIGTFTAIFAATIALAQKDIKKVLAYSTISQLGFMIAALGIGAYIAAAFHLVTHAFFKALLFLGSGSVIHGMEHGAFHSNDHVDPQDMFNMGGLRNKMPITFWTFLIGGLALSGFPLITAGFWSKDEILADAFAHGHWAVLITLSVAALMTAFYTMRQIMLTFFGEPRTKAAEQAHETPWTMTFPLVVLSVFAVGYGWVGIPEHFPLIGGILPNWYHEFVGGSLLHHPEAVAFNWVPLGISLFVALGGLSLGWLVYKDIKAGQADPLQKALGPLYAFLQNKWYIDEFYAVYVIKPVVWVSEVFTSQWMDKGVIDGILHFVGSATIAIGNGVRNYFDKPIINDLIGDKLGAYWTFQPAGRVLRKVQTGRIQNYFLSALAILLVVGALYYFFL